LRRPKQTRCFTVGRDRAIAPATISRAFTGQEERRQEVVVHGLRLFVLNCSHRGGARNRRDRQPVVARFRHAKGPPHSHIVNGAPDYGVEVVVDVESISSDPQDVTIEIKVSCSEGQWTERRTVHLQPKETQRITQFFAQPTLAAKNAKCEAKLVTASK
jgi:hypothetical protein